MSSATNGILLTIVSVGGSKRNELLELKKKLTFNNKTECTRAESRQFDSSHILTIGKECNMNSNDQRTKNQRTKNLDELAALPPINQQQSEKKKKNLGIAKEKEQQEKVTTGGKEEDAEQEGEGPKAVARKNQRGKYRQYEDSQVIVEKIRSYRTQRYPDSEIMKLLDNMPRRTYYNYVKKLQEQDRQITEQWISENVEHFAEELVIHRETLCQKLRELQGIIDTKSTLPRDKMQAIEQYLELSEKLFKFEKSGRLDAMSHVKYSPPSLF
ncbi:MAG: hypothetical protein M3299_01580 [Thermoproteota archaeon]|nr:hypothetical protein [Thermoproteota archaeon]